MHCETGWVQGHLAPCTLHFALHGIGLSGDDDDRRRRRRQGCLQGATWPGGGKSHACGNWDFPASWVRGKVGTQAVYGMSFALLAFMRLGNKVVKGRRALEGGGEGWSLFPSVCKMEGRARNGLRVRAVSIVSYAPAGSVGRHSTLAWIPNSKWASPVDVVLARSSPLPHPRSQTNPHQADPFRYHSASSPSFPIYAVALCF